MRSIRNEGILAENRVQSQRDNPQYQTTKSCSGRVCKCPVCNAFVSRTNFYRHRQVCDADAAIVSKPVDINFQGQNSNFKAVVLDGMRTDDVGKVCQSEKYLITIGERLWQKERSKVDKTQETKKSVRATMRLLARLYLECKSEEAAFQFRDLFDRYKFGTLRQGIESITSNPNKEEIKYGLKESIYYALTSGAEILQANYLEQLGGDEAAREIESFLRVLKANQHLVFGDAKYHINKARQEKLRLPSRTPDEADLQVLRDYNMDVIQRFDNFDSYDIVGKSDFVSLRNNMNCRLTLFNARRGGEPSRLTIRDWEERGKWFSRKQIEQMSGIESYYFKELSVVFHPGKGNHLISTFIPKDCRKAMDILCCSENRASAGVHPDNKFIFANTENSLDHATGWTATNSVLEASGIKSSINATVNRCRISTEYAALDLPEEDRESFYTHMGHSKDINKGSYQRLLPLLALTKVGAHLRRFDQGKSL